MAPQAPPPTLPETAPSANPLAALDPDRTWVFIVGNCAEWEKDRDTIGDVRLWECFLAFCGNSNRVTFVKDEEATAQNAKLQLVKMLVQSKRGDTIVIYYGGHGCEGYFCTQDEHWYHHEVVKAIEEHFNGDRVWILADCCYSGSFVKELRENTKSNDISYLCVMSTQADFAARDDWILTECFIRAMEGTAPKAHDDAMTLEQVIEYTANETARVKRDCMTVYMHGDGIDPNATFPRLDITLSATLESQRFLCCNPLWFLEKPVKRSNTSSEDSSLEPWTGITSCSVGDVVHAKWQGGRPRPDALYIMPVWFRGTVLSCDKDCVQVELQDPFHSLKWNVTVRECELLDEAYFNWHHFGHDEACLEAHCIMARQLKYYSWEIPGGTHVKALWNEDGKLYDATIMASDNVNWERLAHDPVREEFLDVVGAFVPVSWHGEDTWDVMPLSNCVLQENYNSDTITGSVVREHAEAQATRDALNITKPSQALIKGLVSMGKSVCTNVEAAIGSKSLTCFWKDTGEWFPAEAVDDLSKLSLEDLATHLHYDDDGEYCAVWWPDDDSMTLVPRKYVRRRE